MIFIMYIELENRVRGVQTDSSAQIIQTGRETERQSYRYREIQSWECFGTNETKKNDAVIVSPVLFCGSLYVSKDAYKLKFVENNFIASFTLYRVSLRCLC